MASPRGKRSVLLLCDNYMEDYELYPTSLRATGSGVAGAVGRIGGMICPLVAVGLVNGCQLTIAVVLFAVVTFITIVSVLSLPYETKGQELSDT